MPCKKSRLSLMNCAAAYLNLGYQVAVTNKKVIVGEWFSHHQDKTWNNISIILDGIVCVDMDRFISLDKKYYPLPATLKERSPRGLHFFYRLPNRFNGTSKIGWKKNVDILTKSPGELLYSKKPEELWQGHVLCSPSKGYSRLYPKVTPRRGDLTRAPDWILDALQ